MLSPLLLALKPLPGKKPDAEGKEESIKSILRQFVLENQGDTDEEKRYSTTELAKLVHQATAYVMGHLPSGISYVNGKTIRPLLREVSREEFKKLPKPKELDIDGEIRLR